MPHDQTRGSLKHRGRLLVVLALTSAYMVVEATVGFLTDSLVLVADAGHMLTDVAGLLLALLAIWYAQRPASPTMTFGYYRTEILAALANAVLLFGASGYILYEAFDRFRDPPDVPSIPVLVVASIGLGVNLIGARLLTAGAKETLNVRGAFLEILSDILGSIGAIATGVILLTTGWRYADPLFAAAVGLLILPRTWKLLRGAVDVLLEGAPGHIGMMDVQRAIMSVAGVRSLHDLHIWTLTSGFVSLSAHIETDQFRGPHDILVDIRRLLFERFGIDHATVQIETQALHEELEACCGIDTEVAGQAHAGAHRH
jgi:cobalt-zinc-cadmium efflux system protein